MSQTPGLKLGILGGGQLSRMMALAAHPYGIHPIIYSNSEKEPASQVSPYFFIGNLNDANLIKKFMLECDVITFESEFWDSHLLETLSKETKKPIYPSPRLMGLLQDRLTQKQLLEKYRIPTAPFKNVTNKTDLLDCGFSKSKNEDNTLVLKQRRFGYDGYGTFFVKTNLKDKEWENIIQKSTNGFIAEKKIKFKRELALLFARDRFGKIIEFPLVESKQTNARCDWVMGPLKHPQEKPLRNLIKNLLKKENYVGVIAFELFDTGSKLLVNEIAPRVHNSGHYSLDALSLSQFQAHVLAVCGLHLPKAQLLSPFAMANLLGTTEKSPSWPSTLFNKPERVQLHWYGKHNNRPDRKMGHINALGSSPKKALQSALTARKKVKI